MSLSVIMNSTTLYIAVIVGLLLIFLLCAVMLKMAWGRCIELGISQEKIKGVIKSSVIFSIVPSLSIVIGLFSLAAVLGVPWPWFRLSVVGSVSYELMAADMVATGAGYESIGALAAANDASQAGAIMFVMSIGIMFGIVTCTFFGKKIQTSMTSFREKNGAWGALATGCFTLALMVVFLPVQVFKGPIYMLTLAVSALVTYLHGVIIKKTGWTWLSNFVLADSLVLAMVASVFFANLLA